MKHNSLYNNLITHSLKKKKRKEIFFIQIKNIWYYNVYIKNDVNQFLTLLIISMYTV